MKRIVLAFAFAAAASAGATGFGDDRSEGASWSVAYREDVAIAAGNHHRGHNSGGHNHHGGNDRGGGQQYHRSGPNQSAPQNTGGFTGNGFRVPLQLAPNGSAQGNTGGYAGNRFFPGQSGGSYNRGSYNNYGGNYNNYGGGYNQYGSGYNNYQNSYAGYSGSNYGSSNYGSSNPPRNHVLRPTPTANYSQLPIEIVMPDWCEGKCSYQLTNNQGGVYTYELRPGGVQQFPENSEWHVRFHDGYQVKQFRLRGGRKYEFQRAENGAWAFYFAAQ